MKPTLVVWETHHLGDALLSLPFIRTARKNREVWVVCRANQLPLYRAFDPDLKVIEWEPFWAEELGVAGRIASVAKLPGLFFQLKKLGRHEAVSCWADVRVHLLMMICGAGKRAGLPMREENFYAAHLPWRGSKLEKAATLERGLERLLGRELLTNPVIRTESAPAHLEVWRKLAGVWDWPLDCSTPWLKIQDPLRPPLLEWVQTARNENRAIWMVHPGARHPARRWPLESFLEVIRKKMEQEPMAVVFVETATERWPEPGAWQLVIRPESLPEFMAAVNQADVLFCNDSFPAHLGAALGKVVWTIFSNQDPALFAPFQNEDRVIAKNVCEFRPCLDRCLKPSFICLEAVTVEEALRKMLKS